MYALSAVKLMDLKPGTTLGSWTVEAELGRGAMAVVYRVVHETLGTPAALKVLERSDAEQTERLLAEGRAQAAIKHPGVIAVNDVLTTRDGRPALLMELVEGSSLDRVLQSGVLERPIALELFGQIVDAVQAAHDRGLIHRDLKPSNILIAEGEGQLTAKVADFGLVKAPGSDATATRALLGTPRYMAPEQMRSARRIDASADVFALGCILFELMLGRPAFPGDDLVDLYTAKSASAFADPAVIAPDLPEPVVAAIRGALAGSTSRRIPSCATLRAVLDGAPWPPEGAADETLDDANLGSWRCPGCATATDTDVCAACGADTMLAGRFQLVDDLAQSRWTHTWRALDLTAGKWVACRGLSTDAPEHVRTRFTRGVDVLTSLEHPQLPEIEVPAFVEAGRHWEIRELVDGAPLSQVLREERFSEREVLDLLLDLVPVLAYLHERRPPVVHRNLTADNVIRAADGRLVLIDFANVRASAVDPDLGGATFEGTFGAMAPEQYRGDASPATDVYGLGTLAVALLSRQPLAELQSVEGLRWRDAIEVLPETADLLADLLAPEPAARPEIRAAGRRIADLLSDRPLTPHETQQLARTVRRQRWLIGGSVAMAAVGSVALMAGLGLYAMADTIRANRFFRGVSGVFTQQFLVPEPQPADLAGRAFPLANCDTRPVTATVTLDAETATDLVFRPDCASSWEHLGSFEPGVHEIALDSGGTLTASYTEDEWVCADGSTGPRCEVSADATALQVTAEALPTHPLRIVDDQGSPIANARAWYGTYAVPLQADGDGVVAIPSSERTYAIRTRPSARIAWRVEQDGVALFTSNLTDDGVLTVRSDGEPREMRIVDSEGEPVPNANVQLVVGSANPVTMASDLAGDRTVIYLAETRTDADGRFRVKLPAGPEQQTQLLVEKDGFDVFHTAAMGAIPLPDDIELPPERVVRVACAGLDGDSCEPIDQGIDCIGATWVDRFRRDTCRTVRAIDGTAELQCHCRASDIAVTTATRSFALGDADQLWLDFRDIGGGVRGRADIDTSQHDACYADADDASGTRHKTELDADGRFQLDGLHAGYWDVRVWCMDDGRAHPALYDGVDYVGPDVVTLDLSGE